MRLSGRISSVATVLALTSFSVDSGAPSELWHCSSRRRRWGWAKGVRFGLGSAENTVCMTMRQASFVNCCVDRPLQASELKIHNCLLSARFRMIYSLHTLVVTCHTETLPS